MKNNHGLRRLLIGKSKNLKKDIKIIQRYGKPMAKCQKCGQYFSIGKLECHHSVISFREIKEEYVNHRLSIANAKYFSRNKDNIQIVCHGCHKTIHENH